MYLKKISQNINSKKNLKKIDPTAILVLQNGRFFKGVGLGYKGTATGEVCFNTSITGYQEIISDPSYADQIINFTFPHVGNVGTNKEDHESDKIWTKGVIINTEITNPSNYRSLKHLDQWLKKNKIVGITGIDTRNITNLIRDKGAPKGTISFYNKNKLNIKKLIKITNKWSGLKNLDLAKMVTTKKNYLKYKNKYSHARALVNSLATSKKPDKKLLKIVDFVAYEFIHPWGDVLTQYKALIKLGFTVPNHRTFDKIN